MKNKNCIFYLEDYNVSSTKDESGRVVYTEYVQGEICESVDNGGPIMDVFDCEGCKYFTPWHKQNLYSSETHPKYARLKDGTKIEILMWTTPSESDPHRQELYFKSLDEEEKTYFCYLDEVEEFINDK